MARSAALGKLRHLSSLDERRRPLSDVCWRTETSALDKQLVDDSPFDIRQPEVSSLEAIREAFVVDA